MPQSTHTGSASGAALSSAAEEEAGRCCAISVTFLFRETSFIRSLFTAVQSAAFRSIFALRAHAYAQDKIAILGRCLRARRNHTGWSSHPPRQSARSGFARRTRCVLTRLETTDRLAARVDAARAIILKIDSIYPRIGIVVEIELIPRRPTAQWRQISRIACLAVSSWLVTPASEGQSLQGREPKFNSNRRLNGSHAARVMPLNRAFGAWPREPPKGGRSRNAKRPGALTGDRSGGKCGLSLRCHPVKEAMLTAMAPRSEHSRR